MDVSLDYKESWATKYWWFWTVVFELLPAVLFPAWASSNLAVCEMYSAYKLNKQDDKIQSWCTPFLIWNQSVVPCLFLTVASWPTYRFLRKQVRYSHLFKNFPQFVVIHTKTLGSQWNSSRCFLEFSCFFHDPMDVLNLISGPSAFSKSNLNIWKFLFHILLKSSLENFDHYSASM